MTNILKYKSVAIKHDTYEKLKTISKNWIDIELSLAQTVTMLTDMMYAKVTDPHFVTPLKWGKHQFAEKQKKKALLFPEDAEGVDVDIQFGQASCKKLTQMDS